MRAIRGALVWADGALHEDRYVVIHGDRIAAVGTDPGDADVDDWGNVALIPGTVNAHGHAFQSLFKGIGDDRSFESWRDDVLYPLSESLTGDDIYVGALFAFAEALVAGVTTTVDFFYLNDSTNDNALRVIQAARDIGIRLVLARAFYDPDAPTAAPSRYREDARDAADRCRDLAATCSDDALVSVQPAPHSLHAASPATLTIARELAHELGTPWHLHVAEARYELELVEGRYGTTPVRLLQREGLLDEDLIAVHVVWADGEELDLLARSGAGVVHCPGANAFLGDGIAPLAEMVRRGIRVALGPDGGCANNRQSVFDEMRTASLFAKARALDGSALDAATAFDLGTKAGADLLGLPTGELALGRVADLVALDLDDLSLQPISGLDKHIVNSMQATAVARVMVGGEVVAERGRPTRVDLADLRDYVAEVALRLRQVLRLLSHK